MASALDVQKVHQWLKRCSDRLILRPMAMCQIASAVTSGRGSVPSLLSDNAPLVDPVLAEPMRQEPGNAAFCSTCHQVMSVESACFSVPEVDPDEPPPLSFWRPAFQTEGDKWYFMESRGRVPVRESLVMYELPIMCGDNFEFGPGYDAANAFARHVLNHRVAHNARVVYTPQQCVPLSRCIWCRQKTLRHITVHPACEAALCEECGHTYCVRCEQHRCKPSWITERLESTPVRNIVDMAPDGCNIYYKTIYPNQVAMRCSTLALGPDFREVHRELRQRSALQCDVAECKATEPTGPMGPVGPVGPVEAEEIDETDEETDEAGEREESIHNLSRVSNQETQNNNQEDAIPPVVQRHYAFRILEMMNEQVLAMAPHIENPRILATWLTILRCQANVIDILFCQSR